MAHQDDFVKTALRIPRELHAAIHDAAIARGRSMNAEIIGRLQETLSDGMEKAILERLNSRESELLETNRRQLELLWGIIERADVVLERSCVYVDRSAEEDADKLKQDIVVIRQLIEAIGLHKS